jgi:hypothetical protein
MRDARAAIGAEDDPRECKPVRSVECTLAGCSASARKEREAA